MPLCWCIQGPWWIDLCSSSHLYAPGWGKQSEEQKLEKAQSQFSKSKGNQKQNKNKKEVMQRQSLAAHQQTDAQSVSRQLLLWKNSPHFSLSFTANMMLYAMSLVSSGQLFLLCPLPTSFPLPGGTEWERKESLALYKHCSATLKYWCIISTVLVTDLKYSNIQAVRKKINCMPTRPSAVILPEIFCWLASL